MSARPRLIALDADDLAVISAQVQDALVNVADVIWRQDEKRLVIGLQRLDRVPAGSDGQKRIVSALRFDRVLACQSRDVDLGSGDAVLSLLGIAFYEGDPPGGRAVLMFAGGAALRLDVECLECELADLGKDDMGGDVADRGTADL